MIKTRTIHAALPAFALVLAFAAAAPALSPPALAQPRPEEGDTRARQERYNQAIAALQQQHNQQVTGVEQAYNAHRIDRRELDGDIANLQHQYNAGVAEQRRILEH